MPMQSFGSIPLHGQRMGFEERKVAAPATPIWWQAVNGKEDVVGNLCACVSQDADDISALGAAEEVVGP